jgi:hypothetical protein
MEKKEIFSLHLILSLLSFEEKNDKEIDFEQFKKMFETSIRVSNEPTARWSE